MKELSLEEIFSSISTITKDYLSKTRNVMVLGMANDHAGYIISAVDLANSAVANWRSGPTWVTWISTV